MIKPKYKFLITITPLIFIADQVTKLMVEKWMELGARIPIIDGFFDIVHFRNTGAAFGMFSGLSNSVRAPFFYGIAVVVSILLGFYYRSLKDDERIIPLAISFIYAGIAGNILDRIRLGSVIDFLSFHIGDRSLDFTVFGKPFHFFLEWPAFNVADSAITVAMALLIFSVFRRKN